MTEADRYSLWRHELEQPRHQDQRRLTHHGFKVFSQCDEDGILQEIFARIGIVNRTFIEFGIGDGVECNSAWLLMQGWSGLWLDANQDACRRIAETHQHLFDSGKLNLVNAFLTAEDIDAMLASHCPEPTIDLLSIDVDYNDYWIWKAITTIDPRVVVIEYNSSWPPPASLTVPYEPKRGWDFTNCFGASLAALAKLGQQKGYDLVGCSISGVNAFFVRKDLAQGRFLAPGDACEHYEPPRYFLCGIPAGHSPKVGAVIPID